jgi:predicted glycoside hydrolase/deacetylase ChbG (UPF0249 family)
MATRSTKRCLIVNADDFGLTSGINRGIIEGHERGIVTSASLMVRYEAAAEAAEYARSHHSLSVGLHFDLAEWRYTDGEWRAAYQVVAAQDAAALEEEFERQLAAFERLLGCAPTHLDSHQHVHQTEPLRSIATRAAARLNVPLRDCSDAVRYCGGFYGQTAEGAPYPVGISAPRLIEIFERLQPDWTELGCHPGFCCGLDSVYCSEREEELRVLCDEALREALDRNGIELRSFRDFQSRR